MAYQLSTSLVTSNKICQAIQCKILEVQPVLSKCGTIVKLPGDYKETLEEIGRRNSLKQMINSINNLLHALYEKEIKRQTEFQDILSQNTEQSLIREFLPELMLLPVTPAIITNLDKDLPDISIDELSCPDREFEFVLQKDSKPADLLNKLSSLLEEYDSLNKTKEQHINYLRAVIHCEAEIEKKEKGKN